MAQEIKQEIEELTNIQVLVQSYEEIAASYMRRTRNSVLQKREFLDGLAIIFQQVKQSYKYEIDKLLKQKKTAKLASIRNRNGKTVLILLSANTGLYGDIVKRTYNLFLEEVKRASQVTNTDVTIIGRLGQSLFQEEKMRIPITYFDFPDNKVDPDLLKKIVLHLLEYEQIIAFYGRFQSVVTQEPTKSSISGDTGTEKNVEADIKYLFEPSLEHILSFFESEILASIFEQTLYESQLAKFAARMITLDKATENVRESIKKAEFLEQKMKHRIMNSKQLNTLSSFSLWGK